MPRPTQGTVAARPPGAGAHPSEGDETPSPDDALNPPDGVQASTPGESYRSGQPHEDVVADEPVPGERSSQQAARELAPDEWIDAETTDRGEDGEPPHLQER